LWYRSQLDSIVKGIPAKETPLLAGLGEKEHQTLFSQQTTQTVTPVFTLIFPLAGMRNYWRVSK